MSDLADFGRIAAADHGLCIITTSRADATAQASVVSAGVTEHPLTGLASIGLVAAGNSHKLTNLRDRPRTTLIAKKGFEWVAVEGAGMIIGPEDPYPGIGPDELRQLLRNVFTAAGGTHGNWSEYDHVMAAERRALVFVDPERVYSSV